MNILYITNGRRPANDIESLKYLDVTNNIFNELASINVMPDAILIDHLLHTRPIKWGCTAGAFIRESFEDCLIIGVREYGDDARHDDSGRIYDEFIFTDDLVHSDAIIKSLAVGFGILRQPDWLDVSFVLGISDYNCPKLPDSLDDSVRIAHCDMMVHNCCIRHPSVLLSNVMSGLCGAAPNRFYKAWKEFYNYVLVDELRASVLARASPSDFVQDPRFDSCIYRGIFADSAPTKWVANKVCCCAYQHPSSKCVISGKVPDTVAYLGPHMVPTLQRYTWSGQIVGPPGWQCVKRMIQLDDLTDVVGLK